MARAKYQFLPDLSEDDIRLLDRVSDWIMAADEKYITKFSAFLDERQCLLCEKLMASVKYENLGFGADMKTPQGVCCVSILNMARQKVRIFLSPQLHCCIAKRIK